LGFIDNCLDLLTKDIIDLQSHVRWHRQSVVALLDSAQKDLAGELEISQVQAGLQTAGWIKGRFTADRLAKEAERRSLELTRLSRYGTSEYLKKGLGAGFAAIEPAEIRRGMRELAKIFEELRTLQRYSLSGSAAGWHAHGRPAHLNVSWRS